MDPAAPPGTPAEAPPRAPTHPLDRPAVVLALLALGLIVTAGLAGLFEPTETRYAEIAREMRATGDYLIPHLDGIAHLHKPPVAYWAVALGMSVFGENSWGARLPVALATAATLCFTWIVARRRFPGVGAPPALTLWALGTMGLSFGIGRTVATDPFLAAAVAGFWAFAPSPLGVALLGLGFFIKGPVVLVPTLLPVLAAAAWSRDRAPLRLLGPGRAWALFALIALPWFAIVVFRLPGLLPYLLENQIWGRFATTVHRRGGPPWYFLAVLVAGSLPWTAALVAGLVRVARSHARAEARLLFCWLLAPIAFFSCSGSKLPAYLLPCFPAAALFVAAGLAGAGRVVRGATAGVLLLLAGAAVGFGPLALARLTGAAPGALPPMPWPAYAGPALWTLAALVVLGSRPAPAAALVLAGWVALLAGIGRYEGPLGSPRPLARVLEENRGPGEPIVEYRRFNSGLPFYLREHVRLLGVERELFFTPGTERAAVIVTRDSIAPLAARHGRVWILAPGGEAAVLADSLGLDYAQVSQWHGQRLGFVAPRQGRP